MQATDYLFAGAQRRNPVTVPTISRDPDDNPILACAVVARANIIVTGDNDLLVLKRHDDIEIITPKAFAQWHVGVV